MMADSLTEIANNCGTDKGTIGPSTVHGGHNYSDIYEAYLGALRNERVSILEIGIGLKRKDDPRIAHGRNSQGGGSIKMWDSYFSSGKIYGVDIVDGSFLSSDTVTILCADQSNEASLRELKSKLENIAFDVIIDDGSHVPDHQQMTLGVLFPLLKKGGVYFIEDLYACGYGDPIKNGSGTYSDRARHTRSVLKSFVSTGAFGDPHRIIDPDLLAESISSVHFHVPLQRINKRAAMSRIWGGRNKIIEFQADSELLVAIRKK